MKSDVLEAIGTVFVGILIAAATAFILGLLVMWMWNWLMPILFGLETINYIQGWGIMFLCGLLFKGTTTVKTKDDK